MAFALSLASFSLLAVACSGATVDAVVAGVAEAPPPEAAVRLDGQWRFVPEGAVEPTLIAVPSIWNGVQSGKSSGIYTLTLRGLEPGAIYAFRFSGLNTSARVTVDGRPIGEWGKAGMDNVPKTFHFRADGDNAEVSVAVANSIQSTGGIWMPVRFGLAAAIERAMFRSRAAASFVQSSLVMMALYHAIRFALRREERSTLLFSIFCAITVLKAGLSGEQLTATILPWLAGEAGLRLAFLTAIALPFVFLKYLDSMFPSTRTPKAIAGLAILGLPFSIICIVAPVGFMQESFVVFQAAIVVVGAYSVALLIAEARRKEVGAAIMLAGTLVLLVAVVNDILYDRKLIDSFFSLDLGLLLFLISQATAIGRSFAREFKAARDLNDLLEKAVSQRTSELETLTRIDPLTGLINRRHFWAVLEQEWNRWKRYGQDYCVAMIDIDYFKDLNDTLGHAAGDAALKAIASRISASVRKTDTVARYGGEEFCLILPGTGLRDAAALLEKVRLSVAESPIVEFPEPVTKTLSYGVAPASTHADPASLLEAADKLMYRAKQTGRNRGYAEGE